jgi:hypothetical protein
MNKVPDGLNDPQVVDGIEAALCRGPEGTDEPLLFVEAKGRYGDSGPSGCDANRKGGL